MKPTGTTTLNNKVKHNSQINSPFDISLRMADTVNTRRYKTEASTRLSL
jgi:hypothetical protein